MFPLLQAFNDGSPVSAVIISSNKKMFAIKMLIKFISIISILPIYYILIIQRNGNGGFLWNKIDCAHYLRPPITTRLDF